MGGEWGRRGKGGEDVLLEFLVSCRLGGEGGRGELVSRRGLPCASVQRSGWLECQGVGPAPLPLKTLDP